MIIPKVLISSVQLVENYGKMPFTVVSEWKKNEIGKTKIKLMADKFVVKIFSYFIK